MYLGVLGFTQQEYDEIKDFVSINEGLTTNDIDLIIKKHKEKEISFLVIQIELILDHQRS